MLMLDERTIVERHGKEVLVISAADWTNFKEILKEKYPDMYETFKNEMNFNMTPISFYSDESGE